MDKSETYIKMNDRLPEDFPDKYSVNFGDWYYDKHTKESHILFESPFMIIYEAAFVKLHRQDQLQAMVFPHESTSVRQMVEPFYEFVKSTDLICASFEQLWLAFLVKEKYNKVWHGEEWV